MRARSGNSTFALNRITLGASGPYTDGEERLKNGEARDTSLRYALQEKIRLIRLVFGLCLLGNTIPAFAAPLWLDVRSPEEYASGHLADAINIPYLQVAVRVPQITNDLNAEIKVYCAVGIRAEIAKLQLESVGYTHIENMGGYTELQALETRAGTSELSH
ncbi:MAG: hypothetical protein EXR86_03180 [Gammaproteobacteria bacterium]|nr:hypothetical protein [Gammaproteobacteria bacterium]